MAVRELVPSMAWPIIERRYLIGAALAAMSALLVLVVTAPPERVPVLVAEADLPAGTPLGALDIGVRYVESAEGLVTGSRVGDLGDWTLAIPISDGEPITVSNIRAPELLENANLMSISVPEEHAVLGRLAPGDLVDIHHTSAGSEGPLTTLLAQSVYVVDAVPPGDGIVDSKVLVLLAVDDDLAAVLASAVHDGDLDLVRVGP